jgi:hypothetical protein
MRRLVGSSVLLVWLAAVAYLQTEPARLSFVVATVKPTPHLDQEVTACFGNSLSP